MTFPPLSSPFSPSALAAAVARATAPDDTGLPADKHGSLVTYYDGHDVSAALVERINDVWTVKAAVDWHGGEPQVGVQAHASW